MRMTVPWPQVVMQEKVMKDGFKVLKNSNTRIIENSEDKLENKPNLI